MSIGTIVAIVLFMVVMVLGLMLVRTIFTGSVENVKSIDQAVKNEINKLFAEDDSRKIIIYPSTRQVSINKNEPAGFAFSIRNIESTSGTFSYVISVNDPDLRTRCNVNEEEAEGWIELGRTGSISIPPGSSMQDPEFVRFLVPDNAPPCQIRYGVNVDKDGAQYGTTVNVDVNILSS